MNKGPRESTILFPPTFYQILLPLIGEELLQNGNFIFRPCIDMKLVLYRPTSSDTCRFRPILIFFGQFCSLVDSDFRWLILYWSWPIRRRIGQFFKPWSKQCYRSMEESQNYPNICCILDQFGILL